MFVLVSNNIDLSSSTFALALINFNILGNIARRRASKRHRVLFAVVWFQTGQRGVVCYHIHII